jgi:hypothetical protein
MRRPRKITPVDESAAAHERDAQSLMKARRLSSGTFCWRACFRQSARFCRNAASRSRIALRVAGGAVVRSGIMPVTGAVGFAAGPWARVLTGVADAAMMLIAIRAAKHFMGRFLAWIGLRILTPTGRPLSITLMAFARRSHAEN